MARVDAARRFFSDFERHNGFTLEGEGEGLERAFERCIKHMRWSSPKPIRRHRGIFNAAIEEDLAHYIAEGDIVLFNRYTLETLGWKRRNKKYKAALIRFSEPIFEGAERQLEGRLEILQTIISRYQMVEEGQIPTTLTQCRSLLESRLFVNIYDFSINNTQFSSLSELAQHTIETGKFFPLQIAKGSFTCRVLLRKIRMSFK